MHLKITNLNSGEENKMPDISVAFRDLPFVGICNYFLDLYVFSKVNRLNENKQSFTVTNNNITVLASSPANYKTHNNKHN